MTPTNSSHRGGFLTAADQQRMWVVSESGNRWITATRRFITEMMPEDLAASIVAADPSQALALLIGQQKVRQQSIVIWEIDQAAIGDHLDFVTRTSIAAPTALQIAVSPAISNTSAATLTELGVVTCINNVEQLPSLAGLVQRYFAQ